MNDIATAITLSIAADGQTPITANIPMNSKKITGLAAGTTSGDALSYGQASAVLTGTSAVLTINTSSYALALKTSVARGSGTNWIQCQDPTGDKGYLGYGGYSNDNLSIVNQLNADTTFYTNNTLKLTLTADGRLYGSALHNNAGAVTGTTDQYIASGTYTPTLTAVANIGTLSASVAQWMRVGNVVTVSGHFTGTPSSVGASMQIGISLPIASTFNAFSQGAGTGKQSTNATGETLAIYADLITTTRVEAFGQSVGNVNVSYTFAFTYLVR